MVTCKTIGIAPSSANIAGLLSTFVVSLNTLHNVAASSDRQHWWLVTMQTVNTRLSHCQHRRHCHCQWTRDSVTVSTGDTVTVSEHETVTVSTGDTVTVSEHKTLSLSLSAQEVLVFAHHQISTDQHCYNCTVSVMLIWCSADPLPVSGTDAADSWQRPTHS